MRSLPATVRYLYDEVLERERAPELGARKASRCRIERDGDSLSLAAVEWASGELVGDLSLILLSARNRQGEIGFVMHPDHQGRGLAREGAEAVLGLAFDG